MNNIQDRRHEDARMNKLEKNQEKMQDDIVYIKTRIDNGFSTSIQSTEDKVNYIDHQNEIDHKDLRSDIKGLSKKFDKIIWMFVAGAIGVIIKDIIERAL